MRYGVRTEYDLNAARRRDYLTVWSGPFSSVWEADGVSLPKGDGYMLTTYNGDKVRVTCPTPRNDDTYVAIDKAINDALTATTCTQCSNGHVRDGVCERHGKPVIDARELGRA